MYRDWAKASALACTRPSAMSVAADRIDRAKFAKYCLNSVAHDWISNRNCGECVYHNEAILMVTLASSGNKTRNFCYKLNFLPFYSMFNCLMVYEILWFYCNVICAISWIRVLASIRKTNNQYSSSKITEFMRIIINKSNFETTHFWIII